MQSSPKLVLLTQIAMNRSLPDYGERCFSHAGPKAWNALLAELQDLTAHSAFKRQLKTFLFERAFTT